MDRIEKEKQFHNERFHQETRQALDKYYSIAKTTSDLYNKKIFENCEGKTILEYGCGLGSAAFDLAKSGANVNGIDISEIAIEKANILAVEKGLSDRINFRVMNAELLEYPDNYFDLVCGSAILHHLNLDQALSELKRVLKPNGRGVFLEPLGHNIFINTYRKLTPDLRTEDEHPLKREDIERMNEYFSECKMNFFHLTTFFSLPLRKTNLFNPALKVFTSIDNALFKIDLFKYQAWHVVMEMTKK